MNKSDYLDKKIPEGPEPDSISINYGKGGYSFICGRDENGKLWWEYLDNDKEFIEKTERELF